MTVSWDLWRFRRVVTSSGTYLEATLYDKYTGAKLFDITLRPVSTTKFEVVGYRSISTSGITPNILSGLEKSLSDTFRRRISLL